MADITMCNDGGCPHARICFRHNSDPSPMQSWFAESPRNGDDCPEFLEPRRPVSSRGDTEK